MTKKKEKQKEAAISSPKSLSTLACSNSNYF